RVWGLAPPRIEKYVGSPMSTTRVPAMTVIGRELFLPPCFPANQAIAGPQPDSTKPRLRNTPGRERRKSLESLPSRLTPRGRFLPHDQSRQSAHASDEIASPTRSRPPSPRNKALRQRDRRDGETAGRPSLTDGPPLACQDLPDRSAPAPRPVTYRCRAE